jgi:hypothetical protein
MDDLLKARQSDDYESYLIRAAFGRLLSPAMRFRGFRPTQKTTIVLARLAGIQVTRPGTASGNSCAQAIGHEKIGARAVCEAEQAARCCGAH